MKTKKIIISMCSVLAVLVALFAVIFIIQRPETQVGVKQINVTVIYEDKTEKEFPIKTDAEFLGEALLEAELITEDEQKAGFLTNVDGIRADYNKDKAWWCVTKDGQMTEKGINELSLTDGDEFEIVHTPS